MGLGRRRRDRHKDFRPLSIRLKVTPAHDVNDYALGKTPDAFRPFEGRIDRAVGSALDVDPLAHVDARVAACGLSLLRGILHEGEVILAVARNHPVEILAQLHAPLLLRPVHALPERWRRARAKGACPLRRSLMMSFMSRGS